MRLTNLLRLALAGGLLFTLSCKKRGDYEVPCKILKITEKYAFYPGDPYQVSTLRFNYTSWGDPKSLIYDQVSTGKPNYYFYYDNQRRLIRYKQEYAPGNVEVLTRYKYNNNNFIVSDTSWYAGTDENNTATFQYWWKTDYTYDSQGRVSQTVVTYFNGYVITKTYSYDANGNAIRSGASYDNKVNFLRTNLVLAFINRDYSMNNEVQALSYNSRNLPTSFSTDWRNQSIPVFINMMANEIEYSCDNQGPNNF